MEEINNIEVVPCTESDYLKPFRVHYNQNGTKKSWDFMRTHDSVSVLIFNTTSHCFILVKQFRPAVYMCEWEKTKTQPPQSADKTEEGASEAAATESQEGKSASERESSSQWPPASAGVTYELCAGLVDKPDLSLEEIARQEVLEECGYDVPASKLKRITSYRSGVGVTGARQTMFYAEVSDDNCVSAGGASSVEMKVMEPSAFWLDSLTLPCDSCIRFKCKDSQNYT
ncbi:uridine diphosphate glucose pyrophosphatase NUDT14 isoform X2 [Acanthochromis polyacanthus]|uniref:uridine diphosphate glucose pyrophosphatase NUDT14 isoform X2 n=1 Tax=Acanthochromis polyacanthus TaxID=80966 RepID=UPI0022342577|nr:uridine diphosphate glucose pyrophosphatase NUDT14 isoform X2 [Acanthochromis polyacanthus]